MVSFIRVPYYIGDLKRDPKLENCPSTSDPKTPLHYTSGLSFAQVEATALTRKVGSAVVSLGLLKVGTGEWIKGPFQLPNFELSKPRSGHFGSSAHGWR